MTEKLTTAAPVSSRTCPRIRPDAGTRRTRSFAPPTTSEAAATSRPPSSTVTL
jgi:hypothetical protein